MRVLTNTAKRAFLAPQSNEVLLYLIEITHPDWAENFYFVFNTTNITSGGREYVRNNFQIEAPPDSPNSNRVTLLLDNVDRLVLPSLRGISTPPIVVLKKILASEPDSVLAFWRYELRQVQYKAGSVSCTLISNAFLAEMAPKDKMSPPNNRGLYKESE